MAAFLAGHPETVAAMKIIKQAPPSAGFADSAFYGLNAFRFTNERRSDRSGALGRRSAGSGGRTGAGVAGKDYLFDDLIRRARPATTQLAAGAHHRRAG